MQVLDVLAAILVLGAAAAFALGAIALARANDVEALYMLVIGVIALRAGVQIVRPGASA
jgi:multisubunit Na+/H+ antiporter MnhG subunit